MLLVASLFSAGMEGRATASPQRQLARSPREAFTVFRARRPFLLVELSLSSDDLFDVFTRGTMVCSDGSVHHQLFAEGIPNPGHRTVIQENGTFRYRLSLPTYFEAMRGRVNANRVVGRLRFWEISDGRNDKRRCGTKSPNGKWVKFVAHRIKGPPPVAARDGTQ